MSLELWACIHTFYIQYTNRQVINLLPQDNAVNEIEDEQDHGHAEKPKGAL